MLKKFRNGNGSQALVDDCFGQDGQTGEPIDITLKDLTGTHTQIVGASGSGKSYGIFKVEEKLLKKQIDIPYTRIDPEGQHHDLVFDFLAHHPELAGNVIEFNLSEPMDHWPGLNPLAQFKWSPRVSVTVMHVIAAFSKVWAEESKGTPLLRRMLRDIFFPLVEGRLTLMEAEYFLDLSKSSVRRRLSKMTSNTRVQKDWAYFDQLSATRKLEQLGSSANRFAEFLDSEAFRYVMGRTSNVLDIGDVVESGKTVQVNLSQEGGWLYQDDAYLVGALLISAFVAYALTRSEEQGKEHPYILIVDEYQSLVTSDAAKILDQCRKRGLHFVFAHQHLTQIIEQDRWLAHSVMQNARTKLVFSMDDPDDLEIFEKYLFVGHHDLQRVKNQSYSGQEASNPSFWSLPEIRYRNEKKIHELPRQHMLLKREGQPPQLVRVGDVEGCPRDDVKRQQLRELIWRNNPNVYMTEDAVVAEQTARRRDLESAEPASLLDQE